MACITKRLVTAGTTNLTVLAPAPALNLMGMVATNTAAYAIFVKFYWNVGAPTVGTTLPNLTVNVPTLATLPLVLPQYGLLNNGDLWVAVTKLVADTDTTVTVAGDGLITFFLG